MLPMRLTGVLHVHKILIGSPTLEEQSTRSFKGASKTLKTQYESTLETIRDTFLTSGNTTLPLPFPRITPCFPVSRPTAKSVSLDLKDLWCVEASNILSNYIDGVIVLSDYKR